MFEYYKDSAALQIYVFVVFSFSCTAVLTVETGKLPALLKMSPIHTRLEMHIKLNFYFFFLWRMLCLTCRAKRV